MQRQWGKILAGRVSLADFVFAKEVRLGTYSARAGALPPAAIVASKALAHDPRAEPRYGERVPYVVVYDSPGARPRGPGAFLPCTARTGPPSHEGPWRVTTANLLALTVARQAARGGAWQGMGWRGACRVRHRCAGPP